MATVLDVLLTSKLYPMKSSLLRGKMGMLVDVDENSEVTIITDSRDGGSRGPPTAARETSPPKRVSPVQISTIKPTPDHSDLHAINSPVSYHSSVEFTTDNGAFTPENSMKISSKIGNKQRNSIIRGFLG